MVKLGKISKKTKKTYVLHHVVHNGMMKVEVKKNKWFFWKRGKRTKLLR